MPEGPEIARMADGLRSSLEGQRVDEVRFAFPALQRFSALLGGEEVRFVRPRGKAMLIGFSNGLTVYSHNQLYGRWYLRPAGVWPHTSRQLRLAIQTASNWALLYSASEIEVLDEAGIAAHPYLAKLGPDALDSALEAQSLELRQAEPRFARRALAALLLDQSFVAGLGNYLRSEICFEARLHPVRRPIDLSAVERRRLARAILRIPRRAYRTAGVTQPPRRAQALRKSGVSWTRWARELRIRRIGGRSGSRIPRGPLYPGSS